MVSKKFCRFLKNCDKLADLTFYPDSWSIHDKASYLYQIVAGDRELMRRKINYFSGVQWPLDPDGDILWVLDDIRYLPDNAFEVIEAGEKKLKSKYDKLYPYDYIRLCRDCHKHFFDLPEHIQVPQAFCSLIIYIHL